MRNPNLPLTTYRDLDVWQKSMDMVQQIYLVTKRLPDDERYGLTSQMRRAAVSIPSNIAEGYGRKHRREYLRFVSIANGSLKELETQIILLKRLEYIPQDDLIEVWVLSQDVGKMLNKLMNSLDTKRNPEPESRNPN